MPCIVVAYPWRGRLRTWSGRGGRGVPFMGVLIRFYFTSYLGQASEKIINVPVPSIPEENAALNIEQIEH